MRVTSAFRIQENAFAISFLGAILLVLLQLAVTMVAYTGATMAFSAFLDEGWIDVIADTGLTALIIAFFTVLQTELHTSRGYGRPTPQALLLLLLIVLPAKCYAMLAVAGVEKLLEWLPFFSSTWLDYEGPDTSLGSWYSYCVLAPLSEEVFYRGVIGAGLIRWYGEKKGIWLSTAIFAVVHLNPSSVANAAVLGLVLQWLFLKTNNLVYPMLLHAMTNALALLVSTEAVDEWLTSLPDTLIYIAGSLLLLGGIFFIKDRNAIVRLLGQRQTSPEPAAGA